MDRQQIRLGVRWAYSAAADRPEGEHPFPVGREFAERLGYPAELLERLPDASVAAFAGVSNVSLFAEMLPGAAVLDLGCGAGLDALIAAERVGPQGSVVGVDFSDSMLARARRGAAEMGRRNVTFYWGEAESLPLDDRSVDVVMINGIFNLNPTRDSIFRELARVLRPGGAAFAAELTLHKPLLPEDQEDPSNWFA